MFYKSKEIYGLLRSIADRSMTSLNSSIRLLYYLRFPKEDLPKLIAKTLTDDRSLLVNQNIIGQSLAGVHIEELSKILDEELLAFEQSIINRQVNRIALFLEEKKAPSTLTYAFQEISKHLLAIKALLKDMADESTSYAAKEVLLLEELISCFMLDSQLCRDFLLMSLSKLPTHKRKNLINGLIKHLNAYSTLPQSDEIIVAPNLTIQLRPEIVKLKGFEQAKFDLLAVFHNTNSEPNKLIS